MQNVSLLNHYNHEFNKRVGMFINNRNYDNFSNNSK